MRQPHLPGRKVVGLAPLDPPYAYTIGSGFTLIEVLVATALSLLLLSGVVLMFSRVTESVTASRAMLESADRLRLTAARLQQDLAGETVDMSKIWHHPEDNEGYFEYIEGPVTQANAASYAVSSDIPGTPGDTTVGDFDDILMFTTRSNGQPFVGKVPTAVSPSGTIQSDVAEVAWFVRGRTLYRRALLVAPGVSLTGVAQAGFYANYDLSVHAGGGTSVIPNTLGDLTNRQNRFAHNTSAFPYSVVSWWFWATGGPIWRASQPYSVGAIVTPTTPNGHCYLCAVAGTSSGTEPTWPTNGSSVTDAGITWVDRPITTLPTLRECSWSGWLAGNQPPPVAPATVPPVINLDFWTNDPTRRLTDTAFLVPPNSGSRIADDVVLTNVIGFDVKAWDPTANGGAGAYVDLGSGGAQFGTADPQVGTGTSGPIYLPGTYDTWPVTYEYTGAPGLAGTPGRAFNGLDDNSNGVVDDIAVNGTWTGENLTEPPYPYPLRGIQVKIRVFEPDSRQVREVTVVQDFLPQ